MVRVIYTSLLASVDTLNIFFRTSSSAIDTIQLHEHESDLRQLSLQLEIPHERTIRLIPAPVSDVSITIFGGVLGTACLHPKCCFEADADKVVIWYSDDNVY